MERLIYKNALGQEIEFSNDSHYKWIQVDDLGSAEAIFQTASSPYQDGTTSAGQAYFKSKAIKIDLVISSTDTQADIRTLNNILNPKIGLASLTLEKNGITRVLNKVRTRVMPSLLGGASRGFTFQHSSIIFEVFDPFYTDEEYTEVEILTGDNTFNFPLEISTSYVFDYVNSLGVVIDNTGDVDCPITVILDGPKNSPLTIENITTGEKIVLSMALLEEEKLTITTEIDNINAIKANINTGIETVAFQYIDITQTTFFNLSRGENTIRITTGESEVEEATIKYKQRYVGI
jgi:hypothetical protein